MSFTRKMSANMGYVNKNKKPLKQCCGQPVMKSWGIGEGIPPLTSDPENPIKMFAEYETTDEDKDRR